MFGAEYQWNQKWNTNEQTLSFLANLFDPLHYSKRFLLVAVARDLEAVCGQKVLDSLTCAQLGSNCSNGLAGLDVLLPKSLRKLAHRNADEERLRTLSRLTTPMIGQLLGKRLRMQSLTTSRLRVII